MRVEREALLRKLEAVAPGLATKEAVQQSSCFVFRDGKVVTFNDEIACSIACDLGLTGAVAAKPLLELLQKLAEKEVDLTIGENEAELLVKGKGRRAGITLEKEITLPTAAIDYSDEWQKLSPEFCDAVAVVQRCAGKDPNNFHLMCVHITPTAVEACDNYQLARYPVKTPVDACLVKRDSIKHVTGLGVTEVAQTKTWLHFRNPTGLVFSVRRETGDFVELDAVLATEGTPTTLPGGLAEAVEKAEIFSSENSENNMVKLTLKNNQLRIEGMGASGWFEERKDVKWNGEALSFKIDPKMLVEITTKTNDCQIAPGKLRVDGGKFTSVTCLEKA
jgi:hypothetical protein